MLLYINKPDETPASVFLFIIYLNILLSINLRLFKY